MSTKTTSPNNRLSEYVKIYLESSNKGDELEVKFGTNEWNPITKINFNNVIAKLKSIGFQGSSTEDYHLNINNEYTEYNKSTIDFINLTTQLNNSKIVLNNYNSIVTKDFKDLLYSRKQIVNMIISQLKSINQNK